jgi:hydroxymethylpyrimidine pyrophosphatase-like HAD family hydrolase
MLSLESIEKRLENPKAYYIFYQFFYKAAVGEVRWKECMDSSEARIGNDTTEAFARLLFANNYKGWLYEKKFNHGQALWTEYGNVPSVKRDSIVDRLLLDLEFVLEKDTEEVVVRDATKKT